ncbi:hypothetical protein CONLIGDRAFT_676771 [Coniochaeta ligniaria NRRL 30616]|uniref:VWFA domain-containing protein n=1 Tax=Coniochaeta ligniaria NRRL 30616 TaxID=1408157 RepID=A0A1J7JU92_9PEZI|nr:hypothetical protein CONLIGDRAFT_676771 [Coniochaeta ligniaria NRRL 30616]
MSSRSSTHVVGCLLDVSNSMKTALETGRGGEQATDRFQAVLQAALKLAQAEQRHNPTSLIFVGAFGLNTDKGCPPCVDLCGLIDALLGEDEARDDCRGGHERLIALANQNNVEHITEYIRTKLTDDQAQIVHSHLRKHPERIAEFVAAIPSLEKMQTANRKHAVAGALITGFGANRIKDNRVEKSEVVQLARRICDRGWLDLAEFVPRPVADVVKLLDRVQKHPAVGGSRDNAEQPANVSLLDRLRKYIYFDTPMRQALSQSLTTFQKQQAAGRRVLVLVSDGDSTDGDPKSHARELEQASVTLATVYLTANRAAYHRRLYDRAESKWNRGQHKLFAMAARISGATHPIPVLASVGWEVPSSGECALYSTVSSTAALEEFCSLLLSARFGSADILLDMVGRVRLDDYINDGHVRTRTNPSDQGESATCYAHATAAVLHMALIRIEGRIGGCPSIKAIRERILRNFPPAADGQSVQAVLEEAMTWYRPLRFRKVDENGARQAVLRRRPVLTTFHLSDSRWEAFSKHFEEAATRNSVLTRAMMTPYHSVADGGGHAVILTSCDPQSLTFLNSWGHGWGNNGSFRIEDSTVLEWVCFHDIDWLESDLTTAEKQAYQSRVDKELRERAEKHPSILELEARCPRCRANSPIADFTGSVRHATCPQCRRSFAPEPGHLVQALYAHAGLGDISQAA